MKKIYTLIAVACLSLTANAQYDLKVELDNYTNNQVVTGSVGTSGFSTDFLNTNFTITNIGDPIAATDTIVFGLMIGTTIYTVDLTANAVNYITDSIIPTGGTLEYSPAGVALGFQGDTVAGTQRTICAYAAVAGADEWLANNPFDATYNADTNATDNSSCVTYELNGTVINDQVGLDQNLRALVNKTYVANNQLVIENNTIDFNSAAIINVTNVSGQIVATENKVIQRGRNTVQLGNLSTGIYIVTVQVEGNMSATKLMVR